MTDTGARRVHDLIGQRFSALVNGQAYRVERPGFVFTGIRPVWALQTHEGQCLRLTAGHRLKRLDATHPDRPVFDWVPLRALLPGDRIARNDDRASPGCGERDPLTATVRSLRPCGEAPVYDVTVPDVHAFVANGLLVHNCGE
jgi:ribonucleoside-diphosphate reductase alpha chain